VKKIFAAAVPAPEFYFKKYLPPERREFTTHEGLLKLRVVLGKLKVMASSAERDDWMRELAKRTGIAPRTLAEEAEKSGHNPVSRIRNPEMNETDKPEKQELGRQERLAQKLFAAALAADDMVLVHDCAAFLTPSQRDAWQIIAAGKRSSDDMALDAIISLAILSASDQLEVSEIAQLKNELAREYYRERRRMLAQAVRNAEADGNDHELAAALKDLNDLPATAKDGE
jgi:hypothetical protein